jgi:bifunctional N-acetylglucosamine-1-phosphate-uridyltransferase/glucosamine-1-phosphate-acetyltransferase GlmU-like protein
VIRSGAYLREGVIAGDGVMFGNSCEFKNCLLFDHAEVPHFNYVGDSILGYKAHLGAGVILSNVRLDRDTVIVDVDGERISSELRKFGAIVGDYSEIGCNSVLSPGSLIGRNCVLYPGSHWRGNLPSGCVVKVELRQEVVGRKS